jgi:hypothetical protein
VEETFEVPASDDGGAMLRREVVLQPEMAIAGRVVWPDGSGAAGQDVVAVGSAWARTDAEGRFSLAGLRPGEHEVRAGRDRGWRWGGVEGAQALVRAGTTDLELMLPEAQLPELPHGFLPEDPESMPGTGIEVTPPGDDTEAVLTIVADAGAPIAEALVRFWPKGRFPLTGTSDACGRVTLRGWPVGVVGELMVTPPTSEAGRLLVERCLDDWAPRDDVVRLDRGVVTTGTVREVSGRPTRDVEIDLRRDDGTWESVAAARDGAFELAARLPGVVTLRARALGQPMITFGLERPPRVCDVVGAARDVAAGTQGVTLDIDIGPPLRVRFAGWPSMSPTLDATLVPEEWLGSDRASPVEAPVGADGTVEFVQLGRDATYRLWVGPLFDGRFALARGLRGADGVQTVLLESGLRSTVRISGRRPSQPVQVRAVIDGFTARAARRGSDGSHVFWGLPPGTWPVWGEAFGDDAALAGEAELQAGGEVEIVLAPVERDLRRLR